MKVSKKIFIIFSMILLLVSPVTSLGKDIKWILERPVIPVLVKKPANPVMKITLIRTDNQPYVIRQMIWIYWGARMWQILFLLPYMVRRRMD